MGVEGGIGYEEGKLRGGKEEEKGFMREEGQNFLKWHGVERGHKL